MAVVRDPRFRLGLGYAVLMVPQNGPPALVTGHASRAEFLADAGIGDTPAGWRTLTAPHRVVREMKSYSDVHNAIELVRCCVPEHAAACEKLVFAWLRKSSFPRRPHRRPAVVVDLNRFAHSEKNRPLFPDTHQAVIERTYLAIESSRRLISIAREGLAQAHVTRALRGIRSSSG